MGRITGYLYPMGRVMRKYCRPRVQRAIELSSWYGIPQEDHTLPLFESAGLRACFVCSRARVFLSDVLSMRVSEEALPVYLAHCGLRRAVVVLVLIHHPEFSP